MSSYDILPYVDENSNSNDFYDFFIALYTEMQSWRNTGGLDDYATACLMYLSCGADYDEVLKNMVTNYPQLDGIAKKFDALEKKFDSIVSDMEKFGYSDFNYAEWIRSGEYASFTGYFEDGGVFVSGLEEDYEEMPGAVSFLYARYPYIEYKFPTLNKDWKKLEHDVISEIVTTEAINFERTYTEKLKPLTQEMINHVIEIYKKLFEIEE